MSASDAAAAATTSMIEPHAAAVAVVSLPDIPAPSWNCARDARHRTASSGSSDPPAARDPTWSAIDATCDRMASAPAGYA